MKLVFRNSLGHRNRKTGATRTATLIGMSGWKVLRVLVVGSDLFPADDLAKVIQGWGHDAQSLSIRDAAGNADLLHPDVLIVNVVEPFAESCREMQRLIHQLALPNSLVVAITDKSHTNQRQLMRKAGVDLTLVKPFESTVLETLLMLECMHISHAYGGSDLISNDGP